MNVPIKAVDAVMGTGKSKWQQLLIHNSDKRKVIVLPRRSEILRYQERLAGVEGVVALHESNGVKTSLTQQFIDALSDARVILTTHSLYQEYLSSETFGLVREGGWSLTLDEVPCTFERIDNVSGTDIEGCIALDVLTPVRVNDRVERMEVNLKTLEWYLGLPDRSASKAQKEMIRTALKKDIFVIDRGGEFSGYHTFSFREERLNAFTDVTILTYPFKETDLDYWLQIKGYEVEHLNLVCHERTDQLSNFSLEPHDGEYSGKEFAPLIDLVTPSRRGKVMMYGERRNHFSAEESKKLAKGTNGYADKLNEFHKTLRTIYRPERRKEEWVNPEQFMFTCKKLCVPIWANSKHKLPKELFGGQNWIPFNERGVNDHSHKTDLSFLYNVFPFAEVKRTVEAFDIEYNEERYALYVLIQWIWRSAIREDQQIRLYIPSKRMRTIFENWLAGKSC